MLVTSVLITCTPATPFWSASSATLPACVSSMSPMVILLPSSAKPSTMARPILEPPPVTTTDLPFNSKSMLFPCQLQRQYELAQKPSYRPQAMRRQPEYAANILNFFGVSRQRLAG